MRISAEGLHLGSLAFFGVKFYYDVASFRAYTVLVDFFTGSTDGSTYEDMVMQAMAEIAVSTVATFLLRARPRPVAESHGGTCSGWQTAWTQLEASMYANCACNDAIQYLTMLRCSAGQKGRFGRETLGREGHGVGGITGPGIQSSRASLFTVRSCSWSLFLLN